MTPVSSMFLAVCYSTGCRSSAQWYTGLLNLRNSSLPPTSVAVRDDRCETSLQSVWEKTRDSGSKRCREVDAGKTSKPGIPNECPAGRFYLKPSWTVLHAANHTCVPHMRIDVCTLHRPYESDTKTESLLGVPIMYMLMMYELVSQLLRVTYGVQIQHRRAERDPKSKRAVDFEGHWVET